MDRPAGTPTSMLVSRSSSFVTDCSCIPSSTVPSSYLPSWLLLSLLCPIHWDKIKKNGSHICPATAAPLCNLEFSGRACFQEYKSGSGSGNSSMVQVWASRGFLKITSQSGSQRSLKRHVCLVRKCPRCHALCHSIPCPNFLDILKEGLRTRSFRRRLTSDDL